MNNPTPTMDVDTMPVGREMDVLMATDVMGFTLLPNLGVPYIKGMVGDAGIVPHYSKDIAAAWQVLERFNIGIICDPTEQDGNMWRAFVPYIMAGCFGEYYIDLDIKHMSLAKTAALAICRAAYKAVHLA